MFFKAGSNISFSEDSNFGGTGKDAMVITAANDNTTYSAGTGISFNGTQINCTVTDTNTTYSAGTNMSLSGTTFSATDTNTTYSAGTGMSLSGTTFNCTVVNTDTNTTYTGGTGLTLNGTTFDVNGSFGAINIQTTGNINGSTVSGNNGEFNVVRSTGDVIAYYSSDERLKDNVKPIENALEKLQKIRGVEFDWNDKQDVYQGHDTGVIAQEVQKVLPEVVTEREDGMLAVKYEKMIGLLVESIKDLKAEVDDLKQQLRDK